MIFYLVDLNILGSYRKGRNRNKEIRLHQRTANTLECELVLGIPLKSYWKLNKD